MNIEHDQAIIDIEAYTMGKFLSTVGSIVDPVL